MNRIKDDSTPFGFFPPTNPPTQSPSPSSQHKVEQPIIQYQPKPFNAGPLPTTPSIFPFEGTNNPVTGQFISWTHHPTSR